ncbi:MAG: glycosyltransferase [Clostridiales bacterium]|nr:glycosyltransferase [Clostridiales bacterium]
MMKRYIDCYIATETCNLRCHYCYIAQLEKFRNKLVELPYTEKEIRKALSRERLGGTCLINFCAGGETLLAPELIAVIKELLEEGHYLSIVTNGTLSKRFDELAGFPSDLKQRLFIKFSFHFLEVKRLGRMQDFFENVNKMKKAGISFSVEVTPSDELIPYIDELKAVSLENVGALPHITIARDDRTNGINHLSEHSWEEYQKIWGTFDSELFDFKKSIFYIPRKEFCYAGDWSIYLNLSTGDYSQCYFGDKLGNIYDFEKPLEFRAVGCNCKYAHCYNGHSFLALGDIPELETPTYASLRDRLCTDGSHWLQPDMKRFMSQKLVDDNEEYPMELKRMINGEETGQEKSDEMKIEKGKVSIVVPVYNAEKSLGYCINSVLSQTYTNIQLILVNDGSKDGSLAICRNYEKIDPRVVVVDIPNGGVSHARNTGMEYATGEYLQFVDSDDCIAPTLTEKLVEAVELYGMDMAMCAFAMITLENEEPVQRASCTSIGLGKTCVLPRELFFQNMATILWKTAMLESVWNKLYRREICQKIHLKFPEDYSLGEDFLLNMEYFSEFNGAVLLSEELYYYIQENENALTRKFRPDLFENQMSLITAFYNLMEKHTEISEQEQISIAKYTVSKAIQCMNHLMRPDAGLKKEEIMRNIAQIINHIGVRNAIRKSNYISSEFEWIRDYYLFSDVEGIYERLNQRLHNPERGEAEQKEETTKENEPLIRKTPGIVNRVLVKMINGMLRVHHCRYLEMVRNTLIDYGIKATITKSIHYHGH